MEFASPQVTRPLFSPLSSPKSGLLLRRKVLAWTQETGQPPSVRVSVKGKIYNLHKSPLLHKSEYFKNRLLEPRCVIQLPQSFPGGPDAFEKAALFCYEFPPPFDPFSIAALRCAAEFLGMTENCILGNLCERSDLYLNQVILQSWDDTLIVLQKCQSLLPWAEEILIVSRCVESLAFMACMEILDPEQQKDRPIVTLQDLNRQPWDSGTVKEMASQIPWIKDLIALPFEFFQRIIGSLRRQGMKETHISPIIVFYANKWVLSENTHHFWRTSSEENDTNDANQKALLSGIIELLPKADKGSRAIPTGFYFALLLKSLDLDTSDECKLNLQNQIASMLQLAQFEDFLLPSDDNKPISSSVELEMMEKIISIYISNSQKNGNSLCTSLKGRQIVAELWDRYLSRIAVDPEMSPERFLDLIELIPMTDRRIHDNLYKAMNNFLENHPQLSTEEKASICKFLNCQKLSQEICIEAVQNDQMPLRLIVQALFAQQLSTHQAFKECSDSFRYIHCSEFSENLSTSRWQIPRSQLGDSPYEQVPKDSSTPGAPLGFLLHKDLADERSDLTRFDYESASFRIQTLEQEVMSLKRSLNWQGISKGAGHFSMESQPFTGKPVVKRRNALGRAGGCIASVSWASQRKCASKLLKVFRRINMLGSGKSKRTQSTSGKSKGLIASRSNTLDDLYDC